MARPANKIPQYRLHTSTGLARCWVNGRWRTLGKYDSPESRAEYARIVAELDTSPAAQLGAMRNTVVTVDQMLVRSVQKPLSA